MELTLRDITLSNDDEASGNSGLVKFGVHIPSNTYVAVKYLTKLGDEAFARFEQENTILHELIDHQNVITPYSRILDTGSHDYHYLMQKADDDLDGWLDTVVADEDFNKKIDLFIEICKVVLSIQILGYIHRDLHFKNVMINYSEGRAMPMLVDFGKSYSIHGPLELSDGHSPSFGYLLRPPEVEFGLIEHEDTSHILGDSYAIGYLLKSCMEFETISNAGHLLDMKARIKKFIKQKYDMGVERYLSTMDLEIRKSDYFEWCERNQSWADSWLTINLNSQEKTKDISTLSRSLSNLNYEKRVGDLNIAIQALERLY